MTPPPPASHLVNQNRNLPTPPSAAQIPSIPYHKYHHYASNISHIQNSSPNLPPNLTSSNLTSNISATQRSRTARNTPSAPNLISPPYSLNGYRTMATQQPSSYIANSAAGFMNNPVQMAMNMPTQYQDQAALQRAAVQQNTMYPTYPYIMNNPMRR